VADAVESMLVLARKLSTETSRSSPAELTATQDVHSQSPDSERLRLSAVHPPIKIPKPSQSAGTRLYSVDTAVPHRPYARRLIDDLRRTSSVIRTLTRAARQKKPIPRCELAAGRSLKVFAEVRRVGTRRQGTLWITLVAVLFCCTFAGDAAGGHVPIASVSHPRIKPSDVTVLPDTGSARIGGRPVPYVLVQQQPGRWVEARIEQQWRYQGRWR